MKTLICNDCNNEFSVPKRSSRKKCEDCMKIKKSCELCSTEFKVFYNKRNQKYCSSHCQMVARGNKGRESQKKLDWSSINKKSYADGKNHVGGGTSKWYDYKGIRVQGSYELRACKLLDKMVELNLIKRWEYTNDRYPYIDVDDSKRTYLLDFKIFNNDDSFYYVEVKGYDTETDHLKWKTIRESGLKLEVWFNKNLLKLEEKFLKNML